MSIGSALVVLVVGIITYSATRRARETTLQVRHAHLVTQALEQLLSELKDAETGQRGSLLTGDSAYLQPV